MSNQDNTENWWIFVNKQSNITRIDRDTGGFQSGFPYRTEVLGVNSTTDQCYRNYKIFDGFFHDTLRIFDDEKIGDIANSQNSMQIRCREQNTY